MMRKNLFLLFLSLMPLFTMAQTSGTNFFKGTFAQTLSKAKAEGKSVLVDCYTLWCGPCHYMSTNVFPNDTLGKYLNDRFISLQLDMEHGEGPDRQKEFNVKAYPTFIIFDANGKEKGRFEGIMLKEEFIEKCNRVLKGMPATNPEGEPSAVKKNTSTNSNEDSILDEGKGVKFITPNEMSFAQALSKANKDNKLVLVDFWADWCSACKKMDATTMRDTRIGKLMNYAFVNYSINIDTDAEGKDLIKKYNVEAFPTYLIISPNGTEYNRIIGSNTVTGFGHAIADALMGKEDKYTAMRREERERTKALRAERISKLTEKPKAAPKTKVKFFETSDIDKALRETKAKHIPLMAYISDGGWKSDYMTKFLFNDKATADYLNKEYVCLYVDVNSKEGNAIVIDYDLPETFPGTLLSDYDGHFLTYKPGIVKTKEQLKQIIEDPKQ